MIKECKHEGNLDYIAKDRLCVRKKPFESERFLSETQCCSPKGYRMYAEKPGEFAEST